MAEKRTARFGKWLLKVVISYAVFIGIGWLLGRIPAEKIDLSEDMFFNLRMFFMLFGPIYLTLIVKIVLTILTAIKHKEKDTAEQNRGFLLAVTAILLLANLSNAQTAADLSSGLIEGKGLRSLSRSKRYTLKEPFFMFLSSSELISGRSVICKDWDGSFLLRLTEPVNTVRLPSVLETISAVSEVGAKPPAIVIWQLS